ncbi:MAG: efflux RND transporter periplasmic adaptor subunit, partial [Deltaproteobacteria bacterium]|nr:efflux RND transporter periplasmic adaptor subunit [Deltaproteobacteria bacterium]
MLEPSGRTLERTQTLRGRGVTSEAELDSVRSEYMAQGAKVAVLEAQVTRAKATFQKAKIQLGESTIKAIWNGDDSARVVAERYVDDGTVVSANTPLLKIVDLTPVIAIFHVPEREYASLKVDQSVSMETDAWPDERFMGRISRISPVFQDNSRQARVEVSIPNEDQRLKPGMFVKTRVKVESVDGAVIVPADAIVNRDDTQGIFVVKKETRIARWRAVTIGIRQDSKVEVQGNDLNGLVVTLGQQLIEDGSKVVWQKGVK